MLSPSNLLLVPAVFAALVGAAAIPRDVTLDPTATAEAQVRDNTATRAFSAAQITAPNGNCLFIDPNSGDFRENLIPVQTQPCNGSAAEQWDIITAGVHNNEPGFALVVSTLTNGCLNFDPRRAAGNQVLLFSCGGRADGGGSVTNSQLFTFNVTNPQAGLQIPLVPQNGNNAICLDINGSNNVDQSSCDAASPSASQLFTIGGGSTAPAAAVAAPPPAATTTTSAAAAAATTSAVPAGCPSKRDVRRSHPVTRDVTLDPAAVAEAQVRDNTATRAFSAVPITAPNGQCLFIDPNSGDFRENLIPVQTQPCNGSAAEQWDVITAGVHNNEPGFALVVSTLTNGCLNFDPRRAAGNQVLLFSCGGRADGGGSVTNSQLFTFNTTNPSAGLQIPLVPQNGNNAVCLDINGSGLVDQSSCNAASPAASQLFTIGGGAPASTSAVTVPAGCPAV